MLAVSLFAAAPAAEHELDDLRRLLGEQRAIQAGGGWPPVPEGPAIRLDDPDPRLEALAHRLTISRDIRDDEPLDVSKYGGSLRKAVLRFQKRHGLEPDGIVGPATIAALNVPVEHRISQILVNIERLDAEPPVDATAFLRVNVPSFRADYLRDGKPVWSARVIVGAVCDQTPVFESVLRSVVINPSWTVPHRIATEELLPKIQHDPQYLERGGYVLLHPDGEAVDADGVDWARLHRRDFPFHLVQKPGPRNQLGRIKFIIPNPHDVYMHDTPAKHLFEQAKRAHSHGCIRVDKPVSLAAQVLEGSGWSERRISRAIRSGSTTTIPLPDPIPVVVVYRTVEVDDDGIAHFYNDVYERDPDVLGAAARP